MAPTDSPPQGFTPIHQLATSCRSATTITPTTTTPDAADASSPTEAPSPTNQKPPSTTAKPRPAACSTSTAPHLGPATTAGCHPGRPSTRSTWTSGGTSTPKLNSTAALLMTPRTLRTATTLTRATTSTTCRRVCGSPQRKTRCPWSNSIRLLATGNSSPTSPTSTTGGHLFRRMRFVLRWRSVTTPRPLNMPDTPTTTIFQCPPPAIF